ncbi:UNVERIFIED_CONTAM: hypothetical protein FKN15_004764 [Acipenser sinensis]
MVECGRCGEWFHGQCEDLQPDDLIGMEEYMCCICRVTHMGKYVTYNSSERRSVA